MKILYAIQGTGNGHLSRANHMLPFLESYGKVDTFISGANYSLKPNFKPTYLSRGLSFFYGDSGRINFTQSYRRNSISQVIKDVRSLPVEKYDLVITDFEFISSMACKIKNVPCIHFGHQASFASEKAPRPEKREFLGETVLKYFSNCKFNIGLHFRKYDDFIFDPFIREEIVKAESSNDGSIVVYLPNLRIKSFYDTFKSRKDCHFIVFNNEFSYSFRDSNICFQPINQAQFTDALINCHGIITSAGFETPAEALYLKKKLLCLPIENQYEQKCNAAALFQLGVPIIDKFKIASFGDQINQWLSLSTVAKDIKPNNPHATLTTLFELADRMHVSPTLEEKEPMLI